MAVVGPHHLVDEREPQTEAPPAGPTGRPPGEAFREPGRISGVQSVPGVDDGDADLVACPADLDRDRVARARVGDRVVDERQQGPPEGGRGADDGPPPVVLAVEVVSAVAAPVEGSVTVAAAHGPDRQRDTGLRGIPLEAADHRRTEGREVNVLSHDVCVLQLGREQQVGHDLTERLGVGHELVELRGGRVVAADLPPQELGPGVQHGQRGPQLVARIGDEPALETHRATQRTDSTPTDAQPDHAGEDDPDDARDRC